MSLIVEHVLSFWGTAINAKWAPQTIAKWANIA